MKEYTEAIHAKRLLKMLKKKNPCGCCPSAKRFSIEEDNYEMWLNKKVKPCYICQDFIGIEIRFWWENICPCNRLGRKESIKRTWLALEEKGYI